MGDLVRALTPILWHTVRSTRLDNAAAEDVLQTVWLSLVRHSDTIAEPTPSCSGWSSPPSARPGGSRACRTGAAGGPGDDAAGESDGEPEVGDQVAGAQADDVLWRAVQRLPERCQTLLRVIAFAAKPDDALIARSPGHAGGQHRPDPGPVPGQAQARPGRRPAVGCRVNAPSPGGAGRPRLPPRPHRSDEDDLALLARLAAVWARRDPVPPGLVDRLEFALTLDALETEVATFLQVDLAASGTRAGDTEAVRTVTFTSETLDTMVPSPTPRTGRCGGRLDRARRGDARRAPARRGAAGGPVRRGRPLRPRVVPKGLAGSPCTRAAVRSSAPRSSSGRAPGTAGSVGDGRELGAVDAVDDELGGAAAVELGDAELEADRLALLVVDGWPSPTTESPTAGSWPAGP